MTNNFETTREPAGVGGALFNTLQPCSAPRTPPCIVSLPPDILSCWVRGYVRLSSNSTTSHTYYFPRDPHPNQQKTLSFMGGVF